MTPVEDIIERLTRLEEMVTALYYRQFPPTREAASPPIPPPPQQRPANPEVSVVLGEQIVKWDPRAWKGPSQKGKRFRDCPVPYLRDMVVALEDMASRDEPEKADRTRAFARRVSDLATGLEQIGGSL